MATMIIDIDSGANIKSIITAMRQLKGVAKVKVQKEPKSEFNLYESLDRAFSDVRLMMDGKKKEKTVEEFLDELDEL